MSEKTLLLKVRVGLEEILREYSDSHFDLVGDAYWTKIYKERKETISRVKRILELLQSSGK